MPRTSLAGNDAVERRCRMVETKPPLDVEAAHRAIDRLRRPDVVRDRLGAPLLYAQRVEAEVAQLPIEVALPHAADDYMGRFLRVWTPDETGHGEVQARLLDVLGLEVHEAVTDDWLASHLAGLASRGSARLHEIVLMLYHSVGAMNEKLAMSAYQAMGEIACDVGEAELAEALFRPMRRDESMRLGYYRTYARELRRQLRPWQLAVSRWLVVQTYAPVGARRDKHKATLGRTLAALGEDPENPAIAELVQAIAQELLAEEGTELPPFTRRAMLRCVDSARAEDPGRRAAPRGREASAAADPVR